MKHTYSIIQHCHHSLRTSSQNYDVLSAPMEFDPRTTLGAYDEAQGTAKADERKQRLFDVVARALFGERT